MQSLIHDELMNSLNGSIIRKEFYYNGTTTFDVFNPGTGLAWQIARDGNNKYTFSMPFHGRYNTTNMLGEQHLINLFQAVSRRYEEHFARATTSQLATYELLLEYKSKGR